MAVKDSQADNLESDLEEGEVSKFEVAESPPSSHEQSRNSSEGASSKQQNQLQLTNKWNFENGERFMNPWHGEKYPEFLRNSLTNYRREKLLINGPYLSGGNCFFPERKPVYNVYDLGARRSEYMSPFQRTYGSVEDIMTKIDRTLSRNKASYYKRKRRRSKDRYLNKGRPVDVMFRECSPVWKSVNSDSYKRKRYEANCDSETLDRERNDNMKNKTVIRKKEKATKRKRRQKNKEVILGNPNSIETLKKFTNSVQFKRDLDEYRKKQLELLQARNSSAHSKSVEASPHEIDEKDVIVIDSDEQIDSTLGERNTNCEILCLNECLDTEAPNNFSASSPLNKENEKGDDEDGCEEEEEEEKDDDIELIKLRLIALTSNKKKDNLINGSLPDLGDSKSDSEQKHNDFSLSDDHDTSEKTGDVDEDVSSKKCHQAEEIDRNELLLRAEALKTALLKKHQNRIKRQQPTENIERTSVEHSEQSANLTNIPLPVSTKEHAEVSESNKFEGTDDKARESESSASPEKGVEVQIKNEKKLIFESEAFSGPEDNSSAGSADETNFKNITKENQCQKKKLRKRRRRQSHALDSNIKEIKREKQEEDDQELRTRLLSDLVKKKALKENENKFVLVDASQTSNLQGNSRASSSRCQQDSLEMKSVATSKDPETFNVVTNSVQKVKMPKTELQRIIVHLGSESSDDEFLSESNAENTSPVVKNESVDLKSSSSLTTSVQNGRPDYEKNVDLLLETVRRGIESKLVESTKVPTTPEAVYNHLPPSQRLEYMRLKQKIAERERLRKSNKVVTNPAPALGSNNVVSPSDKKGDNRASDEKNPSSNSVDIVIREAEQVNNVTTNQHVLDSKDPAVLQKNDSKLTFDKNLKSTLIIGASGNNSTTKINNNSVKVETVIQSRKTVEGTDSKIVPRKKAPANRVDLQRRLLERKKVLAQNRLHLERLRSLWKTIKIEKMIEEKYEKEIKRLKTQQNFFELKLSQQRLKVKKLADETKQIYDAFQKNNIRPDVGVKRKSALLKEVTVSQVKGSNVERAIEKEFEGKESNVDKSTEENSVLKDLNADVDAATEEKPEVKLEERNSRAVVSEGASKDVWNEKTEDEGSQIVIDKMEKLVGCGRDSAMKLKEYSSPLQSHPVGSDSCDGPRVDPNTIMCQYDLLGKCNDEECIYQHWRA